MDRLKKKNQTFRETGILNATANDQSQNTDSSCSQAANTKDYSLPNDEPIQTKKLKYRICKLLWVTKL